MKLIKNKDFFMQLIKDNLKLIMLGAWFSYAIIWVVVLINIFLFGKSSVSLLIDFQNIYAWCLNSILVFFSIRVLPKNLRKNPKRVSFSDVYFALLYGNCHHKDELSLNYFMKVKMIRKNKKKIMLLDFLSEDKKCLLNRRGHEETLEIDDKFLDSICSFLSYSDYSTRWSLDILAKFFSISEKRTDKLVSYLRLNTSLTLNTSLVGYLPFVNELAIMTNNVNASKYLKVELFDCICSIYINEEQLSVVGIYLNPEPSNTFGAGTLEDDFYCNLYEILSSPEINDEDFKSLISSKTSTPFSRGILINHPKCPRTVAITGALMGTK